MWQHEEVSYTYSVLVVGSTLKSRQLFQLCLITGIGFVHWLCLSVLHVVSPTCNLSSGYLEKGARERQVRPSCTLSSVYISQESGQGKTNLSYM